MTSSVARFDGVGGRHAAFVYGAVIWGGSVGGSESCKAWSD